MARWYRVEQVVVHMADGSIEIMDFRRDCESVIVNGRAFRRVGHIATPHGRIKLAVETTPNGVEGTIDG